ncbi:TrkH family potassium uptake protein [Pseudohaliea sp.]|uniref:TrkH family potassium uptake protein n=1 Tax=Pseudohaliea sp. TaxID=2740289 RepID=UPI0032EC2D85
MQLAISLRILGLLLTLFSSAMLVPLVVAVMGEDETVPGFLAAFSITLSAGLLLWLTMRGAQRELRIRDGFLVTALFWTVLGLFGALPFALTESLGVSPVDAAFESISGLTTTGATVLVGLDDLPRSLLLYRQLLQWLGGIGIIVVAVAVLPMLGIGGMQLYRAETPGPSKDSKLTPRIAETAKALFVIYVALTATCGLAYFAAGMTPFDALCHAFSTVAIGGFSTHDASMGYFDSNTIYLICTLFMLVSAINFGMHYSAFKRRSLSHYRRDSETRFFGSAMLVCTTATIAYLIASGTLEVEDGIVHGLFQAVSITTTTGFATQDFAAWPGFLPMMLMMFSFMGGCVGSTGGGIKAMRLMLIYKQGIRELKQLIHPHAVIPLKVGNRRVEATVVSAVWSFFAVYTFVFIVLMLVLMATGLDFLTAFSAMGATLNNLGPGLGAVSANYAGIGDFAKGVLCLAMLLGRLEVFTLLVLFTPMFWRQ